MIDRKNILTEERMKEARTSFIKAPQEEERLKKLYSYEILDTPAEDSFDKIALLAAQIFETPSAYITFVDKDRVFLKSNLSNISDNSMARKDSLCSLAILTDEVTVFSDTLAVPSLSSNPYLKENDDIRFYAAAPLKTAEGYQLGTVCVTDTRVRKVSEKQLKMLETLASLVIDELESRLASRRAIRVQNDLLNFTIHDLKNPTSTILLAASMMAKETPASNALSEMVRTVQDSAQRILDEINELMNLSRIENGEFTLNKESVYLGEILQSVQSNFKLLAQQKNQDITLNIHSEEEVTVDRHRIQEVFENLISNALKYSHPGTTVHLGLARQGNSMVVSVRDHGQGLDDTDMEKLFTKFARLSSTPTGKERSNGLGLSIVKSLVELHKGSVWAQSEGKDQGTTFYVSLPI